MDNSLLEAKRRYLIAKNDGQITGVHLIRQINHNDWHINIFSSLKPNHVLVDVINPMGITVVFEKEVRLIDLPTQIEKTKAMLS